MCQAPPLEVYCSCSTENWLTLIFKMSGNVLAPLAEYGLIKFLFVERISFILNYISVYDAGMSITVPFSC